MNPDCAPAHCTPMHQLSDAALEQVAAYFRALGEPKRLEILQWLDQRPYNVSELAQRCGCSSCASQSSNACVEFPAACAW